jgi:hypothetical protein
MRRNRLRIYCGHGWQYEAMTARNPKLVFESLHHGAWCKADLDHGVFSENK